MRCMYLKMLMLIGLACVAMPALADTDVTAVPIFRLEVVQRMAAVHRVDVDRAEQFLVTGSDDKTARVWSLPDGKLLATLRPPMGSESEDNVYAVAISPDGSTVAMGGRISAGGQNNLIYLFDRPTGRLRSRLTGLESMVTHLAFSADGRYLAAGLKEGNGIRIWRVTDQALMLSDAEYKDDVSSVAFAPDGRLATTSFDGMVRLYSTSWKLLESQPAPSGKRPCTVVFSPDGRQLAIGYDDTTKVNVLLAQTLQPNFEPDLSGLMNMKPGANVRLITWSADGQFLYAGGGYRDQNARHLVVRWAAGGRGARTMFPVIDDAIVGLKPYGRAGVLFAGDAQSFGAMNGIGEPIFTKGPDVPDLRAKFGQAFMVSSEGTSLRFGLGYGDQQPVRFDLARRVLQQEAPVTADLQPPRIKAPGLAIEGWKNTNAPAMNGVKIPLQPREISRSMAMTSDGQQVVFGTDWGLRLFNHKGAQVWERRVPDAIGGINVTEDSRLIVAAYRDGTIRWHRMEDGEELLALFVHPDGLRWVLWTPQGYYDAAPGGDRLIGWHVNRGPDQAADFYTVAQFADQFYRPALVAKVLATLDVAQAVRETAGTGATLSSSPSVAPSQPPIITIASPIKNIEVRETSVTVTYYLHSPSGRPIREVTVTGNSRPLAVSNRTALMATPTEEVGTLTVTLPMEDTTLALLATDEDGQTSQPATMSVRWRGVADAVKPTLYVLAIGVHQYKAHAPLKFADHDAKEFVKRMQRQKGRLYKSVHVRSLANKQANGRAIRDGFEWIRRQTTPRDVAVVFISSYSVSDEQGEYYLLPYDVDMTRPFTTGLSKSALNRVLNQTAGKLILFLDTRYAGWADGLSRKGSAVGSIGSTDCQAAGECARVAFDQSAGVSGRQGVTLMKKGPIRQAPPKSAKRSRQLSGVASSADINGLVNEFAKAGQGAVVFASSTGNQVSLELDQYQHSAFAMALLEGLAGQADDTKDGLASTDELAAYVSNRVKQLTSGEQMPVMSKPDTTPDFRLFVVP